MYSRAKGGGRSQPTGGLVRRHRGHGGNKKRKVRPKGESRFFCRSDSAMRACPLIAGTIRLQGGNKTNRRMCAAPAIHRVRARSIGLQPCRLTILCHAMTSLGSNALARSKKHNEEYRRNQQSGRPSGGISVILDTPGPDKRRRRSLNIVAA
jgi:hypothetical protein